MRACQLLCAHDDCHCVETVASLDVAGVQDVMDTICMVESIRNFPTGIFRVAEGGENFVTGIFRVAEGGENFVTGIFRVAEGGDNFVTGIFRTMERSGSIDVGRRVPDTTLPTATNALLEREEAKHLAIGVYRVDASEVGVTLS